ncbi:uncharacterized protein ASCRUDRAFT_8269 [Ascoidea rubescens DSM 1968]|uniref:Uncharacterized protein n=1 Tax=Ascoidea rubescens DSM 1968 TaxID=1344418 RepID=A0A1D2VGH8_9ASCO|nr:hypothetical protein ASCRUDRAFT_8269 [Ascoidea rubescens DSM 1968]ODV60650.1 hypothetical protein ASCRUDRAFT_8269 [Ascoidea rubescens DSM 1968]
MNMKSVLDSDGAICVFIAAESRCNQERVVINNKNVNVHDNQGKWSENINKLSVQSFTTIHTFANSKDTRITQLAELVQSLDDLTKANDESSDEVPNYSESNDALLSDTDADVIDDDYIPSLNEYSEIKQCQNQCDFENNKLFRNSLDRSALELNDTDFRNLLKKLSGLYRQIKSKAPFGASLNLGKEYDTK